MRRAAFHGLVHLILGAAPLVLAGTAAQAAPFLVTYEAPGVQSANGAALCGALGGGGCAIGVETFDERPTGSGQQFTTDFGTGGAITGTYTNVQIASADQYGGAGGSGNYAVAFGFDPYLLNLSTTLPGGINYFGFWLSALDAGNVVTFLDGTNPIYQFTPADLLGMVGNCPNAYCGNPNAAFKGQDGGEPFVFVNFFDEAGSFDKVVFAEQPAVGGYESDNHTVGHVTGTSGTPIPEPASAATLVLGLGALAGFTAFRRRWR
jgi:hypothetical protein